MILFDWRDLLTHQGRRLFCTWIDAWSAWKIDLTKIELQSESLDSTDQPVFD